MERRLTKLAEAETLWACATKNTHAHTEMSTPECHGEPSCVFASQGVAANDVVDGALCLEKEGSSRGFSTSLVWPDVSHLIFPQLRLDVCQCASFTG